MGIVLDFQTARRHRQLDFERRALRDLSLEKVERTIRDFFSDYVMLIPTAVQTVRDMCAEYAIEGFLFGSSMAKFGFRGEDREDVFLRCREQLDLLAADLCGFWCFWISASSVDYDELFQTCEHYVQAWWMEGFDTSLKRWRLKLH